MTGVWVGNSDFSPIQDVFAADGPTFIWHDYMAEVAELNELPVHDFTRPRRRHRGRRSTRSAACSPASTPRPRDRAARERPRADAAGHRRIASSRSRPRPARSGRRAAATSRPRRRAGRLARSIRRAGSARAALEELYLDLAGGRHAHPTWEAANLAWIDDWTGREDELNGGVRVPFPGPTRRAVRPDRGVHARARCRPRPRRPRPRRRRRPPPHRRRRPSPPPRRLLRRRPRPGQRLTPTPAPSGALELGDRGALAALVLASAAEGPYPRVLSQCLANRASQCAGPDAVDDDDAVEARQEGIVQVGGETLERGLDTLAVEIDAR